MTDTPRKQHAFRTESERQWARFFTALGVDYVYESERYIFGTVSHPLATGGHKTYQSLTYLPDFYLPAQDCFIEIKGRAWSGHIMREEIVKAEMLVLTTHKDVHIFLGGPVDEASCITDLSYIWYPLPRYARALTANTEWYTGRFRDDSGYVAREHDYRWINDRGAIRLINEDWVTATDFEHPALMALRADTLYSRDTRPRRTRWPVRQGR